MKPESPVLFLNPLELPEVVFAKDQPEYQPLPAVRTDDGCVTSRWSLTWRERLRVLFSGSVWLQVWAFNGPLQPLFVTTEQPQFQRKVDDEAA